jgi:uncharacterized membrane protein YfcA
VIAALTVRRAFDKRILWPFVIGGLVGVPFGVWLLPHLDPVVFKLCLSVLLVLWCPAMLMSQHLPKVAFGGRMADSMAGAIGGAMGGIGGFSGTIPTLWCTLRGFQRDTQRAVIQNFNLAMLMVAFAIHLASGADVDSTRLSGGLGIFAASCLSSATCRVDGFWSGRRNTPLPRAA